MVLLVLIFTVTEHTLLSSVELRLLLISSAGTETATVQDTGYYITDAC